MMQPTSTPILKDVYTNSLYQSTFLPILEKAEIKIKELVLTAFLFGKSKYFLYLAIAQVVADTSKKIPLDLADRDQYLRGLQVKGNYFVSKYYTNQVPKFEAVKEKILSSVPAGAKVPTINTPKEALNLIQSKKLWSEAKGYPNVVNYPKELNLRLNQLAAEPITTQEPGKRPISLWQKAELDTRYEHQMQHLQDLRLQGVELAWISSHPNCSKRCEKWQGKLVALEEHAALPGFRIKKVDGHWVYSLVDIMAQTDKYGYHNNIICGFNCRHHLIPYKQGTLPPKEYSAEDVTNQRKIEAHIREMERNIRLQKKRAKLYNEIGEKLTAKQIMERIKVLEAQYRSYCERHGFAWYRYRIEV